jgi:hypothetical protein
VGDPRALRRATPLTRDSKLPRAPGRHRYGESPPPQKHLREMHSAVH